MIRSHEKSAFKEALKTSTPVFFAYFPLGIVFGLLFVQLGYPWYYAPIMSATTFAGVVQFTAVAYLASGFPAIEIALMAVLCCLRNCFYGLSFLERYQLSFWKKSYLSFSLVDATYSILITEGPRQDVDDVQYCMYLSALVHLYWVLGTLAGAFCLPASVKIPGLDFVLSALFVVLMIEQYKSLKSVKPFVISAVVCLLSLAFIPKHMLLVTIAVSTAVMSLLLQKEKRTCPQQSI